MKKLIPVALLVLVAAGCSPAPEPAGTVAGSSGVVTEESLGEMMAPTVENARAVIDDSANCATATGELDVRSCHALESALAMDATDMSAKLKGLTPPESMKPLVAETTQALDGVSSAGLEAACGGALSKPADTPECKDAQASLRAQYPALGETLAKWDAYIA